MLATLPMQYGAPGRRIWPRLDATANEKGNAFGLRKFFVEKLSERIINMKPAIRTLLATLFVPILAAPPAGHAQTKTQKTSSTGAAPSETDIQKKNVQSYIDLLRRDVRQQKAEIMGVMMLLSAADAAKFWPIYSDYDVALAKLNDQRLEIIKEYAHDYNALTDEEADRLMEKSVAFQRERSELLAATYERVKQALGGVTAARFAQIEHQLLLIIDLQIDSSLPIAGQGS
jgi:hypothetical protein